MSQKTVAKRVPTASVMKRIRAKLKKSGAVLIGLATYPRDAKNEKELLLAASKAATVPASCNPSQF